ncbi:hypothetical protein Moror_15542, partial [Moniliophthora roreri MCA 2997]
QGHSKTSRRRTGRFFVTPARYHDLHSASQVLRVMPQAKLGKSLSTLSIQFGILYAIYQNLKFSNTEFFGTSNVPVIFKFMKIPLPSPYIDGVSSELKIKTKVKVKLTIIDVWNPTSNSI